MGRANNQQQPSYFFLMIFLLVCLPAASQSTDTLSLQHVQAGLTQSSATAILEDQFGFMWVGTPNGVNKYDGTRFQEYIKSLDGTTGLTDGYVEILYEDQEGNLYVGTNQGLNIYDRALNIMKAYPFQPEGEVLQSQYIGALARLDQYFWIGTERNGVYRYDIVSGKLQQLTFEQIYEDGPNNNFIVEIFLLPNDHILVITQASIYILDQDLQIVNQIEEPQDIRSAIQVEKDHFWLGSHRGELQELLIHDDRFELKSTLLHPGYTILSIAEDPQGNIWVGSENNGLSIYSPETGEVSYFKSDVRNPNSIPSNSIWSLHKARNGVMWMGPFKQGLSFYDSEYFKFTYIRTDPFSTNSLSNNIVNCFEEDEQGNLWIGTDGGGLNFWDRKSNSFQHYSLDNGRFNSNVVLSLYMEDSGELWVGTWAKGLSRFDPIKGKYTTWNRENSFLGSNNVIEILPDKKGRIWIVALFGGVHVYNPEDNTNETVHLKSHLDDSEVITMARMMIDSKDQIWVGTQTLGLFRIIEKEDGWETVHYHSLHETRAISNDFINTIVEDEEGNIWVGTQAGLNQYIPEADSFKTITKADGIKDDAIKGIIRDNEGFIWLSTSQGVIRYDPVNGGFLNYDQYDGLQGNQFNASSSYKTKGGELVFGGSNGLNIFRPQEADKRNNTPRVNLTSLKIFNKPVYAQDDSGILTEDISQTDTLVLTYEQSVINFEFQALTYRHPEKVNYAYFLEGLESDWNYVGNNPSATYTNLNAGKYILRIKSSNSDGVWNDQETRLYLSILPPFWETVWFRTLIILLLIAMFYAVYFNRVRNIKKYQTELEIQIDQRTKELQLQKEKLAEAADELSFKNEEIQRFTYAVTHDLKSPLNSIKGISQLIPMEINLEDHPDMKNYLNLIDVSINTMGNLITDISKIARLGKIENNKERLDSNEVMNLARDLVVGRLKERNAQLVIDDNLPPIYGDRNRMIQVFENLMDNAIKYMGNQAEPFVHIMAKENEHENQFIIIDNGTGMDESSLRKLFTPFERFDTSVEGTGLGLYMIKNIIESHDGQIHAESEGRGKGSTFMVTLPKASDPE